MYNIKSAIFFFFLEKEERKLIHIKNTTSVNYENMIFNMQFTDMCNLICCVQKNIIVT